MEKNIETFIGCDNEYNESKIVIFGAPFDSTTSFRPGTRFASKAMRSESFGIETYSTYQDKDLEDIGVFDGGDLELRFGSPESALNDIEEFTSKVLKDDKSGFDPGVTGVFSAYAQKHYFDEIHYIDIVDANAGDHGYPFATNFNPEINIREITANGSYWEDGKWVETKPLELKEVYDLPQIGPKDVYLLHHEELESLGLNIKGIKRIRFWMTFSEKYLTHLKVLENVGMTSIEPIEFEGQKIVPLQFLKAVLPDPASLGPRTKGKTNIGCIFQGIKDGQPKTYYVYNVCDHEECYKEVGSQAISYTTGVPAMIGASMILKGLWKKPGVHNIEEFDPDPFMEELNKWGLPWVEDFNPTLIK